MNYQVQGKLQTLQKQNQSYQYCTRLVCKLLAMNSTELKEFLYKEAERNPCIELGPTASVYEDFGNRIVSVDEDYRRDLKMQIPSQVQGELRTLTEGLIGLLDNYGYLPLDPLVRAPYPRKELIKRAMHILQSFEPAGVGARSLRECYRLQLARKPMLGFPEAEQLLKSKRLFQLYTHKEHKTLLEQTNWSEDSLKRISHLLSGFTMHPVEPEDTVAYAIPEARIVKKEEGSFQVELIESALPSLQISTAYTDSVRNGGGSFANEGLFYARRLLFCLENRNRTLLSILRLAVVHQRAYLNGGSLLQLTMKDAAHLLSLHPSTISRTVNRKYVEYEGRVFSVAVFFQQSGKDGYSKAAIQKQMLQILREEGQMSDQRLSERLMETASIDIARRTVNKYRNELQIKGMA